MTPTQKKKKTNTRRADTHTHIQGKSSPDQPTQGAFGAGSLHRLPFQGGRPADPSGHPGLAAAHLAGAPRSQGDPQGRPWRQGHHGGDGPLIEGPPVDDADWVGGRRAHWGERHRGRVGADRGHQRGEGTWAERGGVINIDHNETN